MAADADALPDAQRVLAPFDASLRQAYAYRSYLDARLAAEERYADDLQRVLDAHPPPPPPTPAESDAASKRHRRFGARRTPTPQLDGHACAAWLAYRHADQAEADARRRRVQLVRQEALATLDAWCKSQERALENLQRNLNASSRAYDEAHTKLLPAARNVYDKKCAEVDELTRQEEATVLQRQQLAELQTPQPPTIATDDASLSVTLVGHDDGSSNFPTTEASSPTGDQHRSLPKFIDAVRNKEIREGWDVAREAAKKSALFSRRGKEVPEYTYDPAAMEALLRKKSRAQREAEELDSKYRAMVIKLETLRLSFQHFLVLAQDQCRSLRSEMGTELLKAWALDEKQARFLADELTMYRAEAEHTVAPHRAKIQEDVELVEEQLLPRDKWGLYPVPYANYWYGVAKDLLFGVKLMDYASSHNTPLQPPLLVQKCIAYLDAHALDVEGLYRISAKRTALEELARKAEKDEQAFTLTPDQDDPATVAGLLKRYLRELPDPVLPLSWENMMHYTSTRVEETRSGWPFLRQKIRKQPPVHQATLRLFLEHLARVAGNSQKNKMTSSNLALVLGPVIFFGATAMENTNQLVGMEQDRTMEDLIVFGGQIFEDLTGSTSPFSSFQEPASSPSSPSFVTAPSAELHGAGSGHAGHQHTHSLGGRAPWVQKASLASNLVRRVSEGPVVRSKRIQGRHRPTPSSPFPVNKGLGMRNVSPSDKDTGPTCSAGTDKDENTLVLAPQATAGEALKDDLSHSPTGAGPPPVVVSGYSPPPLPPRPASAQQEAVFSLRTTSLEPAGRAGGLAPPPIPPRPSSNHTEAPDSRRTSWEGTYLAAQSLVSRTSTSSGSEGYLPSPLPTGPNVATSEPSRRESRSLPGSATKSRASSLHDETDSPPERTSAP